MPRTGSLHWNLFSPSGVLPVRHPRPAPPRIKPLCGPRPGRYHGTIMARPIRILGIDPGLRRTGWGVIEVNGNRLSFVACGSVATDDKAALAMRLVTIHDGLVRVVADFRPDQAGARAAFVKRD